jgi:hypothetical protein
MCDRLPPATDQYDEWLSLAVYVLRRFALCGGMPMFQAIQNFRFPVS